jgi:hypothetical protein
LLPPSSSEPGSRSTAIIAASERNGSHNISEATTSLTSPIEMSNSQRGIFSDATTATSDRKAFGDGVDFY